MIAAMLDPAFAQQALVRYRGELLVLDPDERARVDIWAAFLRHWLQERGDAGEAALTLVVLEVAAGESTITGGQAA